jgi:IclR family acetate operon transcriptional repressor
VTGVKTLQTVDRALAALDVIAEQQPIGVSQLAREMGLDKSAAQRVLVSLQHAGWIRGDGSTPMHWVLTTKPLQLARQVTGSQLVARARPVQEQLCEQTGETVWLGVVDGHDIVAIDGVESHRALRTSVRRGLVMPTRASASGKAVLAALPEDEWGELLREAPSTALRAEVAGARRRGYATNLGEVDAGINSVAAAVTSADGRPIGALIVSAPADRLSGRKMSAAGRAAAEAAAQLSALVH